jgi:NitT/TauT family transport system substrate-binding protein
MRMRRFFLGLGLAGLFGAQAALADSAQAETSQAETSQADPSLAVVLPEGLSPRTVGFYLALDRGYYGAAGVAVTLTAAPGDERPLDPLVRKKADLAVEMMPIALKRREAGDRIVHVAQIFRKAGLEVVCRPAIDKPEALKNHVVGVWFGGLESSFYAWIAGLQLNPFGGPGSVTVLRQNYGLESFQRYQSDCATTFSYAAPIDFAAADIPLDGLKSYSYQEIGQATLEDGLYAREDDLAKPDRVAAFARFLNAARRGWQLAHISPKAAFDLLQADPKFAQVDPALLKEAIAKVDDLLALEKGPMGRLDPDAYDRTVNLLLTAAPDPVLTRAPAGAVSDAVVKGAR